MAFHSVNRDHLPRDDPTRRDVLDQALTGQIQSVTQSVTAPEYGVAQSRTESPKEGTPRGKSGSGGRIRTYDLAASSRPFRRPS